MGGSRHRSRSGDELGYLEVQQDDRKEAGLVLGGGAQHEVHMLLLPYDRKQVRIQKEARLCREQTGPVDPAVQDGLRPAHLYLPALRQQASYRVGEAVVVAIVKLRVPLNALRFGSVDPAQKQREEYEPCAGCH